MKTYRVEVGDLVETGIIELDLPSVVVGMLREAGAHSANIYEETP